MAWHGKPVALYSDKHSAFRNNMATADGDGMSNLGRALDALNIEIICANSPQAKGQLRLQNLELFMVTRVSGHRVAQDADLMARVHLSASEIHHMAEKPSQRCAEDVDDPKRRAGAQNQRS